MIILAITWCHFWLFGVSATQTQGTCTAPTWWNNQPVDCARLLTQSIGFAWLVAQNTLRHSLRSSMSRALTLRCLKTSHHWGSVTSKHGMIVTILPALEYPWFFWAPSTATKLINMHVQKQSETSSSKPAPSCHNHDISIIATISRWCGCTKSCTSWKVLVSINHCK